MAVSAHYALFLGFLESIVSFYGILNANMALEALRTRVEETMFVNELETLRFDVEARDLEIQASNRYSE